MVRWDYCYIAKMGIALLYGDVSKKRFIEVVKANEWNKNPRVLFVRIAMGKPKSETYFIIEG